MTLNGAVLWGLAVAALATVAIAAALVGARARRRALERRREALTARHRTDILTLVAGEPVEVPDAVERLSRLSRADWVVLEPQVVALLSNVRGEAVRPIHQVLSAHRVAALTRRQLRSWDAVQRGRAAHLLGLMRDADSRRPIERLMHDRDRDVRIAAVRALGRIGNAHSAAPLLGTLHGRRHVPAGVVAVAVAALGPESADTLAASLGSRNELVRLVCCDAAGLMGESGTDVVPALCNALRKDHSPDVRQHAADALGRIGDERSGPYFSLALRTHNPPLVKAAVAEAVGRLGDPAHARDLEPLLDEPGLLGETAAEALLHLGDTGREVLQRHVSEPGEPPSAATTVLALAALREREASAP